MAEDRKRQAAAERKYRPLKRGVEEAGFYAPYVVSDSVSDHLTCCAEHRAGNVYTGRIAFVTKTGRRWYIATPHPFHYRVLDSARIAESVVVFLKGEDVCRFLVQIDHEEFRNATEKRPRS